MEPYYKPEDLSKFDEIGTEAVHVVTAIRWGSIETRGQV